MLEKPQNEAADARLCTEYLSVCLRIQFRRVRCVLVASHCSIASPPQLNQTQLILLSLSMVLICSLKVRRDHAVSLFLLPCFTQSLRSELQSTFFNSIFISK